MQNILIKNKYIWFPVQKGAGREKVNIYLAGEPGDSTGGGPVKIFEFDLPVVSVRADFYAALYVGQYIGRTITVSVDFPADGIGCIEFHDEEPAPLQESRPELHFTPASGWVNDPNGLVLHDGVFHMYYQYNPYDTKWGNMHWGHAVSKDLTHWKQENIVMYPDEHGGVFSGCALPDKDNLTGHGWNAILYFYTAAGGSNLWSGDKKFTQRLAYSTDAGATLQRDEFFQLDTIDRENRDPKVFYHSWTRAYIMVLFFEDNDFGIFRSQDLNNWELTQRLTLKEAWECPDLFELPVEGSDETLWVFWAADGYYYTGTFDGFRFTPSAEMKNAYVGTTAYAAQTFAGVQGRVISVSWLRISPPEKSYSGTFSIPSVLSMVNRGGDLRMRLALPAEFTGRRTQRAGIKITESGKHEAAAVLDQPYELCVGFSSGTRGSAVLYFGVQSLFINFEKKTIVLGEQEIIFDSFGALDLDIIVDYDVIELRAQNDSLYYVYANPAAALSGNVFLDLEFPGEADIAVYDIK